MSFGQYLLDKQPLLSRPFSYALTHDQLAHAYLVVGESGTPLKETALTMAKSILCDHPHPFADEECIICQRIDRDEYPDFVFLNGEEATIKIQEVRDLLTLFSQTPLETKGIMVYVIHLVENMTPETVNALLKFLEEPISKTYAILTTQNEDKVLPTILSRCEKLRLVLTPRQEVLNEALSDGVETKDAEILSCLLGSGALIKAKAADETYQKFKDAAVNTLDALIRSTSFARFTVETEVAPLLTTKPAARLYFDILALLFQDVVATASGNPLRLPSYAKITTDAAKQLPHVETSLLEIMTLRGEAESNLRINLILVHLVRRICKES